MTTVQRRVCWSLYIHTLYHIYKTDRECLVLICFIQWMCNVYHLLGTERVMLPVQRCLGNDTDNDHHRALAAEYTACCGAHLAATLPLGILP